MRATLASIAHGLFAAPPLKSTLCWRGQRATRKIAVTFDDGPNDHTTGAVLDILKDVGVSCTFFMLGREMLKCPDVLERVKEEGHEIAVHGFDHSARDVLEQIVRCEEILREHGLVTRLFRPAHGRRGLSRLPGIKRRGYSTVLWSFDAMDSMRHEKRRDQPVAYEAVQPGDIILMHDDNPVCLAELPIVIETIRGKGLAPVTVSDLLW